MNCALIDSRSSRCSRRIPALKALVSRGYSDDPVLANCREFGFAAALVKPYSREELGRVLHEMLAG